MHYHAAHHFQYAAIIESGSQAAYIVCLILAILLSSFFIINDSKSWHITEKRQHHFYRFLGISSLVGAALPAYVAGGWVGHLAWHQIIGPKTILGGVVFCCLIALIYKKYYHLNFATGDAFARGGCLMMFIGRLGCILQHCCFGIEVTPNFGIDYGDGLHRLPIQTIEAFCLGCIFLVVNYLHQKNKLVHRRLYVFFLLYGLTRFILEFYREQIANTYFYLGFYQWLALFIFLIGGFQLIRSYYYLTVLKLPLSKLSYSYTF